MPNYDERNPLSPNYRCPQPEPNRPSPTAELIESVIGGVFAGLFWLAVLGVALTVMYGVVLLIFRHAFGVELPNPFNWFR
jgi:sterol desaturase/sphingolipid hydroxylase (fatty acid hydroxylase superfamily)